MWPHSNADKFTADTVRKLAAWCFGSGISLISNWRTLFDKLLNNKPNMSVYLWHHWTKMLLRASAAMIKPVETRHLFSDLTKTFVFTFHQGHHPVVRMGITPRNCAWIPSKLRKNLEFSLCREFTKINLHNKAEEKKQPVHSNMILLQPAAWS